MSGLEGLYQQVILDHQRERHGFGLLGRADAESHQVNPTCGDEITLQLAVEGGAGGERVTALGWEGQGCAISQASASLLADLAPGLGRDELRNRIERFRELMRSRGEFDEAEFDEALGDAIVLGGVSRYVARVKCAMLAWVAAEEALDQLPSR